ncbi:hypothetical protein DFH05DRAFT_1404822 [Lentinula detonsa]|uniref:non-specific serine/threonine protein kinase n=1 Tax=Lentinula detonsa TaxID=2804962 RepID=A0A9W8NU28_9AGAR|nr:hypothetical protein DFH05DRAFT_1404822 [Lentinula detonsa]KAJ3979862.1 hypothetical protein F5890DRAFT_1420684 [Lentinula detonsa]
MDINSLCSLSSVILGDSQEEDGACTRIYKAIKTRLEALEAKSATEGPLPVSPWRETLSECAQKLAEPHDVDWMDDDDDRRYVQHALDDIVSLYKSREAPLTHEHRISVLEFATRLYDLLTKKSSLKWSTIPFCVVMSTWLLQGPNVPTDTKRKVFVMAAGMVRLHTMNGASDETLYPLARITYRNLLDANASVRLNAGKALGALIALYGERNADVWERTDACFAQFYGMMEGGKLIVKETAVLVVGGMAKDPTLHSDIVGQALCFLVAQLGRSNPVLKGSAYMQIMAAAKNHKKTSAYPLLLPYMDKIAPFLVTRMCSQPTMISESCRLMCISVTDFLRTTLAKTLPTLFANREQAVLEAMDKELGQTPSSMFLHNSHGILAHVYRLDQGTQNALDFITKMLSSAAVTPSGKRTIVDAQSITKSCVVPLLAELVTALGDHSEQVAQNAIDALRKVDRVLNGRDSGQGNLGAFLKNYMLGLISNINDMLQDVQGRKSVDAKKKILRSLGVLVSHTGSATASVAPQIMATFQTMVGFPELCEETLYSWCQFITMLNAEDIAPHVGSTSAAFVNSWSVFTPSARSLAKKTLRYIIVEKGSEIVDNGLEDLVDISTIPELHDIHDHLVSLQGESTPVMRLSSILERAMTHNHTMAVQSLNELKQFMLNDHQSLIRKLASGDVFDPLVGQILTVLLTAAGRDIDEGDPLRPLAFECLSILGAVDPDRCELRAKESSMIVYQNFEDDEESIAFALHLITDLLVEAFRSTSDMRYQSHLAFTIQELLRFCNFTPALITPGRQSVPVKVRKRWNSLPKHILETVTPLLEARYNLIHTTNPIAHHPIYSERSTYREWIQLWTMHLISRVSGRIAQRIFGVFPSVIRNKDVAVAHRLLPHLVLNVLLSGSEESTTQIRLELLAVLEDQVNPISTSSSDKKILSAQAVFMLLDHLNRWLRRIRQGITKETNPRQVSKAQENLVKVDSVLSNINQDLLAKAALQCKAYALSLMNFESRVVELRQRSSNHQDLPTYYEHLHEIYAHLDEPDGMEGVSTMILSPSLEHQIRHHESSGHWTSAQSCWEVRLQQSPDNVDYHLGLLRCLRNLGHYDTLRTHVRGVLTRNPDWQPALAGFQIESAWMVGAWEDVQNIVHSSDVAIPQIVIARLLLAMRSRDPTAIATALHNTRMVLGGPIAAAGVGNYRRSYEAMLDLHLTYELETIHKAISSLAQQTTGLNFALMGLSEILSARLDSTLPTFRTREPILSMRRTAFALIDIPGSHALRREVGRSWLASAKIARKAGQWQTAYSAMLQAQQSKTRYSFMESAKLVKAMGDPLHALQQLENSMQLHNLLEDNSNVVDLTTDDDGETLKKMKAKVRLVRARWMNESERFDARMVLNTFSNVMTLLPNWESGQYYLGQFQDECYKLLPFAERNNRGLKMNLSTIRAYAEAINLGTKYTYQTVPRLLTLWLDLGEDAKVAETDTFRLINHAVSGAIKNSPIYKWFTAFPQIVSRIGHTNPEVYKQLARLIAKVIQSYPNQALWLFAAVLRSKKRERSQRGSQILQRVKNNPSLAHSWVPKLVTQSSNMTTELLELCNFHTPNIERKKLTMTKDFPQLASLGKSDLIIPLQESLTASLPPLSSPDSVHQPFPSNAPTFAGFAEEIEIMHSLAKPRKITIHGSDGQTYMFLGKPKDDLRKDARLMDFNAIINKLLKANSESRRRQLHIRTYGVVTLNEECGFIQWVPHTRPVRPVLVNLYNNRKISGWSSDMADVFARIKAMNDGNKAAELFTQKILSLFPPVFHEWFIETFPEPTAWLNSRLTYARTAAVMSMVGFILGLGDRHSENILLDDNTGDLIHVDFNCLFEKGKTLETPERVPFRLTQNLVDALGVTGVEGVFRTACEVTMQLLRDNKDSLMSVLDAFVHDPLVEWEEEKIKLDRKQQNAADAQRKNSVKPATDLRSLAKNSLKGIEKKLRGHYRPTPEKHAYEKEVSTSNLVQLLIQEATDTANLARMYPGWASWH